MPHSWSINASTHNAIRMQFGSTVRTERAKPGQWMTTQVEGGSGDDSHEAHNLMVIRTAATCGSSPLPVSVYESKHWVNPAVLDGYLIGA